MPNVGCVEFTLDDYIVMIVKAFNIALLHVEDIEQTDVTEEVRQMLLAKKVRFMTHIDSGMVDMDKSMKQCIRKMPWPVSHKASPYAFDFGVDVRE